MADEIKIKIEGDASGYKKALEESKQATAKAMGDLKGIYDSGAASLSRSMQAFQSGGGGAHAARIAAEQRSVTEAYRQSTAAYTTNLAAYQRGQAATAQIISGQSGVAAAYQASTRAHSADTMAVRVSQGHVAEAFKGSTSAYQSGIAAYQQGRAVAAQTAQSQASVAAAYQASTRAFSADAIAHTKAQGEVAAAHTASAQAYRSNIAAYQQGQAATAQLIAGQSSVAAAYQASARAHSADSIAVRNAQHEMANAYHASTRAYQGGMAAYQQGQAAMARVIAAQSEVTTAYQASTRAYTQGMSAYQSSGGAAAVAHQIQQQQMVASTYHASGRAYQAHAASFVQANLPIGQVIAANASALQTKWVSALQSSAAVSAQFSDQWWQVGRSLTQVGMIIGAAGAVMVGAVGLAIKAGADFEDAFAGVRKTVDFAGQGVEESAASFQELARNFRDVAMETGVAAVEIAKVGQIAGQLGVRGVEDLTQFARTVAIVAQNTNMSTELLARGFAQISGNLREPISNINVMGDVLTDLGNKSRTTEAIILELAKRISGAGGSIGLTSTELLGLAAGFASTGLTAEVAGTAIPQMMLKMNKSVIAGGGALDLFAKTAALAGNQSVQTSAQFAKTFETAPVEAFLLFVEGLGVSGKQAGAILSALGFDGARLGRTFMMAGAAMGSFNKDMSQVRESVMIAIGAARNGGAAWDEFGERMNTTTRQLGRLAVMVTEVGIVIYEGFRGPLRFVIDLFQVATQTFLKMPDSLQQVGAATVLAGGSFLILIGIMGILGGSIAKIMAGWDGIARIFATIVASKTFLSILTWFSALAMGIPGVGSALAGLGAVFTAFAVGPVLLVLAGLAAIGTATYLFATRTETGAKAWETFKEATETTWRGLKVTLSEDIWGGITNGLSAAMDAVNAFFATIRDGAVVTYQGLLDMIPAGIGGRVEEMRQYFASFFDWVADQTPKVATSIYKMIPGVGLLVHMYERGEADKAAEKAMHETWNTTAVAAQRAGERIGTAFAAGMKKTGKSVGEIVWGDEKQKQFSGDLAQSFQKAMSGVANANAALSNLAAMGLMTEEEGIKGKLVNLKTEAAAIQERYGAEMAWAKMSGDKGTEIRNAAVKQRNSALSENVRAQAAQYSALVVLDNKYLAETMKNRADDAAAWQTSYDAIGDSLRESLEARRVIGMTETEKFVTDQMNAVMRIESAIPDSMRGEQIAIRATDAAWAVYYDQRSERVRQFYQSETVDVNREMDARLTLAGQWRDRELNLAGDNADKKRIIESQYSDAVEKITGQRFSGLEAAYNKDVQDQVNANLAKLHSWDDAGKKQIAIVAGTIGGLKRLRDQDNANEVAVRVDQLSGINDLAVRRIEVEAAVSDGVLRERQRLLKALQVLNQQERQLELTKVATLQELARHQGKYFDFVSAGIKKAGIEMFDLWDNTDQLVKSVAQSMQRSLSDLFFNVITGETEDLMDVFKEMGKSMLRVLTDFLASAAVGAFLNFLGQVLMGGNGPGGSYTFGFGGGNSGGNVAGAAGATVGGIGSAVGGGGGLLGGIVKAFGGGGGSSGGIFTTPNTGGTATTIAGGSTGGIFDSAGNFSGTTGGFDWGGADLVGNTLDTGSLFQGTDFGNFNLGTTGSSFPDTSIPAMDFYAPGSVLATANAGGGYTMFDPMTNTTSVVPAMANAASMAPSMANADLNALAAVQPMTIGDMPTSGYAALAPMNEQLAPVSAGMDMSLGSLGSGAAGAATAAGGAFNIYQGAQSGNYGGIGMGTLQLLRGGASLASMFPEQTGSALSSLGFAGTAGQALTAVGGAAGALAGAYGIYQGIQTGGALGVGQAGLGAIGTIGGIGTALGTGIFGGTAGAAAGTVGATGIAAGATGGAALATGTAAIGATISAAALTLAPIAAVGAIGLMNAMAKEQARIVNQTQESAEIRRAFDEALPKLRLAAVVTAALGEINALAPDAQVNALMHAAPILEEGIATIGPISNLFSTGGTGGATSLIKELPPDTIKYLQEQIAPMQVASIIGYMRVADALAARGQWISGSDRPFNGIAGSNLDFLGLVRQLQQYAGLPPGFDPLELVNQFPETYANVGVGNLETSAIALFSALNPGFQNTDAYRIGAALPQITLPPGVTQADLNEMAHQWGIARADDLAGRLSDFANRDDLPFGMEQVLAHIMDRGDLGALMRIGQPGAMQAYMNLHGLSVEDLFRVAPGTSDMRSMLPTYHSGGVVINAEPGEIVMNKRASTVHYNDLMAWNDGREGAGGNTVINITVSGFTGNEQALAERIAKAVDDVNLRRHSRITVAGSPRRG